MAEGVYTCKKCGEAVRNTMGHHHPCNTDKERHKRNLESIARIMAKWAAQASCFLLASCGSGPFIYEIPPS